MTTELVPQPIENNLVPPEIPEEWDYNESIKKVQPLVYKWKNISAEIANELWVAREKLSSQGMRTDLATNVEKLNWSTYCEACGILRNTANLWLSKIFNPHMPELPIGESQLCREDAEFQRDLDETNIILQGLKQRFNQAEGIQDKRAAILEYSAINKEALKLQNHWAENNLVAERKIGEILNQVQRDYGQDMYKSFIKALGNPSQRDTIIQKAIKKMLNPLKQLQAEAL